MTQSLQHRRAHIVAFWVTILSLGQESHAQYWTSLGVWGDTCYLPIEHSYTCQNFSSGTGSSYHGYYEILKDGQVAFTSEVQYTPALRCEHLYVRSSDMVVAVTTSGPVRRSTDGMLSFPIFSAMGGYAYTEQLYFPSVDLGYGLAIYGSGIGIWRLRSPIGVILFSTLSVELPADTTIYETVPAFESCTAVDTITFPVRNAEGDTTRIHIVFHQLTGVDEAEPEQACSVVPNPSSGAISLSCIDQSAMGSFAIRGMDGREVATGKLSALANGVNVDGLHDGTYLLVLSEQGKRTVIRFVKGF